MNDTMMDAPEREHDPTKGTQSLHRAMQLLGVVGEHNLTGIRLSELAQATGLHVATAHRLLGALVREDMIAFDNRYTKRYFLGLRLHSLTDLARYAPLRTRLRAFLSAVVSETGGVGYVYVPLLNDTVVLERVEAPDAPKTLIVDVGRRLPMGVGAASIAFLAGLPPHRARDLVDANAQRFAEFPPLDRDAVWRSVEDARAAGYGITREQVTRGMIGIGVALRNSRGEPEAAITIVDTTKRMKSAHIEACVAVIRREKVALEPFNLATQLAP